MKFYMSIQAFYPYDEIKYIWTYGKNYAPVFIFIIYKLGEKEKKIPSKS